MPNPLSPKKQDPSYAVPFGEVPGTPVQVAVKLPAPAPSFGSDRDGNPLTTEQQAMDFLWSCGWLVDHTTSLWSLSSGYDGLTLREALDAERAYQNPRTKDSYADELFSIAARLHKISQELEGMGYDLRFTHMDGSHMSVINRRRRDGGTFKVVPESTEAK